MNQLMYLLQTWAVLIDILVLFLREGLAPCMFSLVTRILNRRGREWKEGVPP
jgi:hypothetical protein